MDSLPKLDRDALRLELERVVQEVADAVDDAPVGRILRDSEEKARDALDRFRQAAYEKALQLKMNAAEAAFPPPANTSGKRLRNKGRQPYRVLSINGCLKLWRTRWHDAQAGSCTRGDAWLDEAEATISEGLREMCCRLNQGSTSFRQAAANLARTARVELCAESERRGSPARIAGRTQQWHSVHTMNRTMLP